MASKRKLQSVSLAHFGFITSKKVSVRDEAAAAAGTLNARRKEPTEEPLPPCQEQDEAEYVSVSLAEAYLVCSNLRYKEAWVAAVHVLISPSTAKRRHPKAFSRHLVRGCHERNCCYKQSEKKQAINEKEMGKSKHECLHMQHASYYCEVAEMKPVNAIELYVKTMHAVMKCNEEDPETFADFYRVVPIFRDSLSCLVCRKLLQHPIAAINSTCQHSVCKACKGKKMSMKQSCSGCKDIEKFEENRQLNLLVDSYRHICEYFSYPPLVEQIATAASGGCPEMMFMLDDILALKVKQESSSHLNMPSPTRPLSPATLWGLPSSSQLTEQSTPFLDTDKAPKDEPQDYAIEVKVEPTDSLEISLSELLSMDAATAQESTVPRDPSTITLNSFDDIKPESVLFSVNEALENLDSSCMDKDIHNGLQKDMLMSVSPASGQSESRACTQQEQKPPAAISCSAVTPRTARVNRKRSRSESDSVKVRPLPVTSFIEEPPVAAPAPPTVTHEPKDTPYPFAEVPSEGFFRLQQALLGTTANIEQNLEQSVKRVCVRSPRKDKTQQSPTPGITPRSPPKVYKKTKERKGCKCGRATQNPSVLTCRGQRCPCYSSRRACLDCICRGCQNSYMANGEKKLEAFAVPEKALEQTRLTFGINYTGIPVRNARANQSVVSVSADSKMASFLLASSQDTSQHQKNF